ncbi:MAG TPA: CocE/NonD family hydrolase, partial [Acidimicrobiales bacterium]|nr:CocE/NonD family hydrolase [Acidimicrobiales bacterium]
MRIPTKSLIVAGAAAVLAMTGLGVAPTQAAGVAPTSGCVASVPEPGTTDPVQICYSLFKPVDASAAAPVPLIFHSHGWGGSRTSAAGSFASWTDAGYGVLSFDQRGFGQSGGKAHVENPDFEGQDVQKLVDMVAGLDWVAQDAPGDPVLGAIGGSYGGGYQFVGAFSELRDRPDHATRFNALAPEITWWDLKESLAPQEAARTAWITALYATGATAHTTTVHEGLAYGAATGDWPKGQIPGVDLDAFFLKNGPAWHVSQGRTLDIPVLFGQGITDTLFPLHQGLQNWAKALTPAARARSIFVGYNGGHVLPNAFPYTPAVAGDPCSKKLAGGSFRDLTLRFFDHALKGKKPSLKGYGEFHLATAGNTCTTTRSVTANASYPVGTVATSAAAGAPLAFKVADGPLRIAGTPYLDGTLFAAGVNNRAFYGLAVGTSPADAQLVQGNVLPLNELLPVAGEKRSIELPSVAVDVPKGQSLFVLASAVSDMFAAMGSRTPGAVVLQDAAV